MILQVPPLHPRGARGSHRSHRSHRSSSRWVPWAPWRMWNHGARQRWGRFDGLTQLWRIFFFLGVGGWVIYHTFITKTPMGDKNLDGFIMFIWGFIMFIWGFPNMVVPNNHVFVLLRMIILECYWGYHHLRKHPDTIHLWSPKLG